MARSVLQITLIEGEFKAQKQKVMLIEDNEDCREILATMILLMDYEVILPDGDVVDETADGIVVDLDFPQMRTIHTIHALRDDPRTKDIPIIVFLPRADDEGAMAAFSAGADDVFNGPIQTETLQAVLRSTPRKFSINMRRPLPIECL